MSNSDGETVDENQPPASTSESNTALSSTPADDISTVPKHLRSRYWNSFEDMRLVELWRLYSAEVTTLKKNIPIFRKINEGMREYGFMVNSQDVRRRINNFKNKYIAERRRMDSGDKTPSDWKLYPLVHCLLAPRQKNQTLTHQKLILDQLYSKIPSDLLNQELPISEIELPIPPPPITAPLPTPPTLPREPRLAPSPRYQAPRSQPYVRTHETSSNLVAHIFTKERLTQIQIDNGLLSQQRDTALKKLKAEERSVRALESYLTNLQKKHECLLQRLQCADGK